MPSKFPLYRCSHHIVHVNRFRTPSAAMLCHFCEPESLARSATPHSLNQLLYEVNRKGCYIAVQVSPREYNWVRKSSSKRKDVHKYNRTAPTAIFCIDRAALASAIFISWSVSCGGAARGLADGDQAMESLLTAPEHDCGFLVYEDCEGDARKWSRIELGACTSWIF